MQQLWFEPIEFHDNCTHHDNEYTWSHNNVALCPRVSVKSMYGEFGLLLRACGRAHDADQSNGCKKSSH